MNITSVFRLLATILWFGTIGLVVISVLRAGQNRPIHRSGFYIMISVVVSLVFSLLGMGMVFIEPQERGVVISAVSPLGYRPQALQPGLDMDPPRSGECKIISNFQTDLHYVDRAI